MNPQTAFISERQILDCSLLANEMIDNMRKLKAFSLKWVSKRILILYLVILFVRSWVTWVLEINGSLGFRNTY
jgi:hypothetical protein